MDVPARRQALSHEMFHGLTPDEFGKEAGSIADAEAMTPEVRTRLEAQLVERLKTPVDPPSWGPDWAKKRNAGEPGVFARMFGKKEEDDEADEDNPLSQSERNDAQVIARNMEKSRQVAHYKGLYIAAVVFTLVIALAAMFVDYQIIRGDIWTRALSNEFMVVPASLQSTVVFKSMQVIFAVLIIHFMLKITGVYGRNILVTTAFLLALVMIGCLGYLVAYNNMQGGTSTTLEHQQSVDNGNNSIDQLFSKQNTADQQSDPAQLTDAAAVTAPTSKSDGFSLGLPKLSDRSLANADSWFWLAFASVIFFIVTAVAALYVQGVENNIRNFHLSRDYRHRQRQFAQLHLLEVADQRSTARASRNATAES
jgi:ABC-type multidrug transport system fused ATPase/permease subunit